MSSCLALGTVQFGLPYGVANQSGQVSCGEVAEILAYAWAAGLNTLDTAIAYGESEQRLGEVGVAQWQVISKLPAIPEDCIDIAAWVEAAVCGSLWRLKIPKLYGLLLHRPLQLLGSQGPALYRELVSLKEQGKVEKIGVSIYCHDELEALWPHYRLDLVQAPFNILDRRLATSGWLARLHHAGIEVHVRSVFLQGLLLMGSENRPAYFNRWRPLWDEWHRWLTEQALTPLEGCLHFAMSQPEVGRVVVGVDSLKHLQEIVSASSPTIGIMKFPSELASETSALINPSEWIKS